MGDELNKFDKASIIDSEFTGLSTSWAIWSAIAELFIWLSFFFSYIDLRFAFTLAVTVPILLFCGEYSIYAQTVTIHRKNLHK